MPEENDPWAAPEPPKTCFIAMPITTTEEQAEQYGDSEHWNHVMEELFVPAITLAGFTPVPPVTRGSEWIHGVIIKQLSEADMVLVDLSSHNPNVFFELGVRTSIDKPVALVRAVGTRIPFDTSGMNAPEYDPDLRPWTLPEQVDALAEHIKAAAETCAGRNPMWRQFGLTIKAEEPAVDASREDAILELLADSIDQLRGEVKSMRDTQQASLGRQVVVHQGGFAGEGNLDMGEDPGRDQPSTRLGPRSVARRLKELAEVHNLEIDVYPGSNGMLDVVYANPDDAATPPGTAFKRDARTMLKNLSWDASFNTRRIGLPGMAGEGKFDG